MKNVYIHMGPPKSGTSAIQKWLNENRDYLLSNDIYYPKHEQDENGVSSGNLLSLFSQCKDDFVLDEEKLDSLIADFHASSASRLLLSSEFFFKRMELLSEKLPNAIFVGYLRFPLEVAESSYNQGVKRHSDVHAFGLPPKPRAYQLEILDRLINKVGKTRFVLRPYSKACFVGGNLLEDFLSVFNVPARNIETKRVNTSYTLEGLEFKRWFNQLQLHNLQFAMDRFLQRYQKGTSNYSFVPPAKYQAFKKAFVEQIANFCSAHDVANKETFIKYCKEKQQKPKLKQHIDNI